MYFLLLSTKLVIIIDIMFSKKSCIMFLDHVLIPNSKIFCLFWQYHYSFFTKKNTRFVVLQCFAQNHQLNNVSECPMFFQIFCHQTWVNACSGICRAQISYVNMSHMAHIDRHILQPIAE